uniref:Uncharacterized protein n=1 Tax=Triticum urartu TaxID=4572 RepID=A0A8R7PZI8_TRIUA
MLTAGRRGFGRHCSAPSNRHTRWMDCTTANSRRELWF